MAHEAVKMAQGMVKMAQVPVKMAQAQKKTKKMVPFYEILRSFRGKVINDRFFSIKLDLKKQKNLPIDKKL